MELQSDAIAEPITKIGVRLNYMESELLELRFRVDELEKYLRSMKKKFKEDVKGLDKITWNKYAKNIN